MKSLWFLMIGLTITVSACGGDDENVSSSQVSSGGSAGATATGGASSVAGASSQAGGETSSSGGESAVAGTSSVGGTSAIDTTSTEAAGSSSVAGASSAGGATSVGGASAIGGASSTGGSSPVGFLNCAAELKGAVDLVPAVLKHRPESSGMSATFYAACGQTVASIYGWGILCPKTTCDPECTCTTYVPSKYLLRFNVVRDTNRWAAGSLGNSSSLCPNNYDATTGCLGKEDLIRYGFTFVNDVLMTVDDAEKNPQNNGYNFLYQAP